MTQAVVELAAQRQGEALFNFTYLQWLESFKTAAAAVGLKEWFLSLYVLRHAGPSHDYLAKRRSLADIQRRGRWALESSVRRYEKAARVTARLSGLHPSLVAFFKKCDDNLETYFHRRSALPALPSLAFVRRR